MRGKRYQTVQRCSELLRLSKAELYYKLRLEFQLVQIKRLLLLGEKLNSCEYHRCDETAFDHLEALVRELHEAESLEPVLDRLWQKITEILEGLHTQVQA